ncbi:MAG: type II toxin-antitoxin system death-on-curing family toxin [Ewingella sp.]|uniref:type II toxin-antitoxin system death-on-curing family toxin n=1 Tax=Ewingella sp. TaxID=1897459 RepID=UPI003F90D28D
MAEFVEGINYLSVEDIIDINRDLIEAQTPDEPIQVINQGGLESSQARPSQIKYYEQTVDMYRLSSALIESLIQNHAFANANKRTAMMAGYIFLLLNGYELTAPDGELVKMAEGMACKEYSCEELEDWLFYWSREYDSRRLCSKKSKGLVRRYTMLKLSR